MRREPARRYFSVPTGIILVISEKRVPQNNMYFDRMRIRVVTGNRYLGGLLRDVEVQTKRIVVKAKIWVGAVEMMPIVVHRNIQTEYHGVVPYPYGTIYLVDINETNYWGSK